MMKYLIVATLLLHGVVADLQPDVFGPGLLDIGAIAMSKSTFKIVHNPVLKELSKHSVRPDIKKRERANADSHHEVVFSVKENLDDLKLLLDDISSPFSANYAKHLKRSEVAAMTSNLASADHILSYLALHGIEVTKVSKYSEFITAVAPISKWEELLNTEFHEFHMDGSEQPLIRADHYSLSENLHEHVSAVFNTVQFPLPKAVRTSRIGARIATTDVSYEGYVTPSLLNSVYDIRDNTGSDLASQCVFESLDDAYSPSDLTLFQETFSLPLDDVDTVIGGHDYDDACEGYCVESNLDVQYMMALSQGTPMTYYYWDGEDHMLGWVTEVAEMEDPPKVLSISYGGPEAFWSQSSMDAFNAQGMKLASMGVTIVVASGDDGAGSFMTRSGREWCGYHADFPSVSPYVTSVGGTMGPETGDEEVACQVDKGGIITGGGGFSDKNPAPSWQTAAIAEYFASAATEGSTPPAGYNAAGRGFPDVSLLSTGYLVMVGGGLSLVAGTSASAPVFAAMVSLVNARRLEAGKSTLGWINPALYALRDSFVNDITSGDNHCGLGKTCCEQGFTATAGWDPVTGLGSLNYTAFEAAFLALGDNPNVPSAAPTPLPGAPTVAPIRAPTAQPSEMPSEAPSLSGGWAYLNYYTQAGCGGDVVRVEGWRIGACFTGLTSDEANGRSFKYSCDSVGVKLHMYSDSVCTNELLAFSGQFGCSTPDSYYYDGESEFSTELMCQRDAKLPLDNTFTFAVMRSYNTIEGDCTASTQTSFKAFRNRCLSRPSVGDSHKINYPDVMYYNESTSCVGHKETYTVDSTCTATGASNTYYYYSQVYTQIERSVLWTKQTATATRTPTVHPTASPTLTPEYYSMSVSQTLTGLSAADFNSDPINSEIFSEAVVDCFEDLDTEDVTISSVTDGVSTRLRRLADGTTNIDYSVLYNAVSLGFAGDAEGAYNHMVSLLNAAVTDSSNFLTYLAEHIAEHNVSTPLSDVTGSTASANGYTSVSSGDDDDQDNNGGLSRDNKIIIGVVVGVVGLFICLMAVWMFVFCAGGSSARGGVASTGSPPSSVKQVSGTNFEAVNTNDGQVELAPAPPPAPATVAASAEASAPAATAAATVPATTSE